ncbi:hypothetical protein DICA0_F00408 [Diutina catenulata]
MKYQSPLPYTTRSLSEDILVVSCPFGVVGARMVLFRYGTGVVVWSPIPWGPEFKEILDGWGPNLTVKYVIIPNAQHCLVAHTLREAFPQVKYIASSSCRLKDSSAIDYAFAKTDGNRVIDKTLMESNLEFTDPLITTHFEFVYLTEHKNRELVVYENASKTIFIGDMLFNLWHSEVEQYSAELGGAPWGSMAASFISNPNHIVGKFMANYFCGARDKKGLGLLGISAVLSLDFVRVVMCHGNDLEDGDVKKRFREVFY